MNGDKNKNNRHYIFHIIGIFMPFLLNVWKVNVLHFNKPLIKI